MAKSERQRREKLGRRAENLAALYLMLKGYRIIERRFKIRAGEVDLIARKGKLLVAVEVKARQNLEQARESISYASQNRIERTMEIYIDQRPHLQGLDLRFDAVFVIGKWRVVHEPDYWR